MRLAVVTSGFPRRSETFALNELAALDAAGHLAVVIATRPGEAADVQPHVEPLLFRLVVLPDAAPRAQAAVAARIARDAGATALHGYFAHRPAEVAWRASRKLGLPFGMSAHAHDLRKADPVTLPACVAAARIVVACNRDAAGSLAAGGARCTLLPHGVDLLRFARQPGRLGSSLELLAVGRLVPKKGFDIVLEALTKLAQPCRLTIVGEGSERQRLAARIDALGLAGRVTLRGALSHADLPAAYAAADVVVVPSVVDPSGDRDGLPNVLLEAMASARAIVASQVGSIGDAIDDGVTGLLVPAGDPAALSAALGRLAGDPGLRAALGARARARVERDFSLPVCTARFVDALERALV